ncbi:site-specific integrase [Aquibium microcysteis]|uniref:site-specific integrase n=1 Tax=Aquibium microcysteis TaxID=675281 RepID=UPI00165CF305|nr:site-specific integrase [Aquibium microcysteis]
MKYVHFVRGRYVVRVIVPIELRAVVGKRELSEKLGPDKILAERRAHGVIAGFLAQLEEAREKAEARKPKLSSIAKSYFQEQLDEDDRARMELGQDMVIGLNHGSTSIMATQLRLIASGHVTGENAEVWVDELLNKMVTAGVKTDMSRPELIKLLAKVELDVTEAIHARDKFEIALPSPKSEPLKSVEAEIDPEPVSKSEKHTTGISLADVLIAFHKERTAGNRSLARRTIEEHKVAVRMFEEFIGGAVPVRSITRADMLAYKQALLQTPSRYALRFPGLTLPQAIKANAKRTKPYPMLDPATINMKWLSHMSTILRWASNNGHIDANPAHGVRVDEGNGFKEPSRVPFNQDDLKRIFGSELFRADTYGTKQWALLLALFTGARSSSEIARIRLCDIYEEQDVPVIMLALASKNQHSKRLVPIHKHLIDRGFLRYVERLRNGGQTRLFPDWEPEDKINRWFLRSYRSEVGIEDPRKVFHSFRHTLKTALARYGVNRDVSDLITGHKDQSVGGIYIDDANTTMINAMANALNRISFPEVCL